MQRRTQWFRHTHTHTHCTCPLWLGVRRSHDQQQCWQDSGASVAPDDNASFWGSFWHTSTSGNFKTFGNHKAMTSWGWGSFCHCLVPFSSFCYFLVPSSSLVPSHQTVRLPDGSVSETASYRSRCGVVISLAACSSWLWMWLIQASTPQRLESWGQRVTLSPPGRAPPSKHSSKIHSKHRHLPECPTKSIKKWLLQNVGS